MEIKKGKVVYAQIVPDNYTELPDGTCTDAEAEERKSAVLPIGRGDFIRRHIYEMRFGIGEETDDERRQREYLEWWYRIERFI
jgi:hypothetical protein